MIASSLKKPVVILSLVIVIAVLFWPLPAQFKYIGSQFLTFALALYVGLRIWRASPRGQNLKNHLARLPGQWLVIPLIFLLAAGITYLTLTYVGYWPRVLIEFILVIGIIFYGLREFKRFLI